MTEVAACFKVYTTGEICLPPTHLCRCNIFSMFHGVILSPDWTMLSCRSVNSESQ